MKRVALVGIIFLVVVGAGVGFFWPFGSSSTLSYPGIVEIQDVRLGSKVGGRVVKVMINEGDMASPGQPLVQIDVPELTTQRAQWQAKVDAAQASLDKAMHGAREEEKRAALAAAESYKARFDRMTAGYRIEEKRQTESELATTRAELKQAEEDLLRILDLYRSKSAAKAELDAATSVRDQARGKVNSSQARYDMMQTGSRAEDIAQAKSDWEKAKADADLLVNGTRPEDISLAKANVDEAKAKLAEIDVNLKEAVVAVPQDLGKVSVEVVAVRPGDIVAAGQMVVRVLRADDLWVKIFVPETEYGKIREGAKLDVTVDSYPGKVFSGIIVQKANISEFTPRNVQSVDERHHQVFAVKIRIDNPQQVFNAGMAAQVSIPLKD